MWLRRALPTAFAAGVVLLSVPTGAVPAQAEPVPTPYSGGGHADIATADVSVQSPLVAGLLADTDLAGVTVGHTQTHADSGQTPRTSAESANLEASILGGSVSRDQASATAPPSASYDRDLVDLSVPALLSTTDLHGSGEARWAGDSSCVTDHPLATSTTQLASATIGDLDLPLSTVGGLTDMSLTLAELGAGTTTSTTELVAAGSTHDVRSTTAAHLATTELLNGLVKLHVADPSLVARSDGSTGTTKYNDPVVSLTADTDNDGTDDLDVPDVRLDSGASLPVVVTLLDAGPAGTLTATVDVTANEDTSTISGARASVSVPSVLSVDLEVSATGLIAGLLGNDVASASLALLPLSASATAPAGGVECEPAPPVIAQLTPPVIAQPADGSWTFDHTPAMSGTGVPGATVHVHVDGSPTAANVTASSSGSWAYVPSAPLSTGTHNVVATQTLDGLSSGASNHPVFHIAERPDVTAPTDGSSSYELTPPIEGTGQPGGRIEVIVDGSTIGTTTVDRHGEWQLTPSDQLSCGRHSATAEQTVATLQDTARNVSFRALCVHLTGAGGGDTQTGTSSTGARVGSLPRTGAPAGVQWLAVLGAALTAAGVALSRRGLQG